MAGVKGRSGRKSIKDEVKRLRVIEQAWDLVEERMKDQSVPDRFQLARDIVVKDITTTVKGEGFSSEQKIINIIRPTIEAPKEANARL